MPKSRKAQKTWVYAPRKKPPPPVPAALKKQVEDQANELVESVLKPKYVQPPPEIPQFNYIVDIYTKWFRNYFYFCSKYRSPGPHALSEYFESKFARMKHVGDGQFALAFMRYTGEWIEVYTGLTLDQCLSTIRDDAWFQP